MTKAGTPAPAPPEVTQKPRKAVTLTMAQPTITSAANSPAPLVEPVAKTSARPGCTVLTISWNDTSRVAPSLSSAVITICWLRVASSVGPKLQLQVVGPPVERS